MSGTRISGLWGWIFLVVLVGSVNALGKVIYVDDNASLGGNGQNWATPYRYLQDALGAAVSGDEIRVAEGIYKPDQGGGNAPGSRYATFQLKNGVAIKGGYAGFGQPEPDARDPNTHETILSGDLLGNDGPDFANNGENSYHVVTGSGTNDTAVLDGFTITAGNANDSRLPHDAGGGMINESGNPTVINCTFTGNSAENGGGMANTAGSPTITNCAFASNSARFGGGMYNNENSPMVTNCTFTDNSVAYGGGMANNRSNPTLTNCTFSGNSAEHVGGEGLIGHWKFDEGQGSIAYDSAGNNHGTIYGAQWTAGKIGTSLDFYGPGRYVTVNAAALSPLAGGSQVTVALWQYGHINQSTSTTTFRATYSSYSEDRVIAAQITWWGTVYWDTVNAGNWDRLSKAAQSHEYEGRWNHWTFTKDSSAGEMKIYLNGSLWASATGKHGLLAKAVFFKIGSDIHGQENYGGLIDDMRIYKRALSDGEIDQLYDIGQYAGFGGGMFNYDSSPTFTNCTFSGNTAADEGGGMDNVLESRPTLANCILWGNTAPSSPQIYNDGTGSATVSYSDVQGGWPGQGNINANPQFVDPAFGDYHLLPGSTCIDAGDNSAVPPSVVTDLDGNERIVNGIVDMGAYEHQGPRETRQFYVDADAKGANNGSSWADAFNDLQDALATAGRGDKIHVARGIYSPEGPLHNQASNPNPPDGAGVSNLGTDLSWTPGAYATSHDVYFGTTSPGIFQGNQIATTFDQGTMAMGTKYYWRIDEVSPSGTTTGTIWSFTTMSAPPPPPMGLSDDQETDIMPLDRTATFQLINGVVIKGGYAGAGAQDPNARDIQLYETILSGDLAGNDEPNFVNYEENSYHVVTGSGTDATAVLDGFIITAGYANGSGHPDNSGGGMYNTNGSPTIINCTFSKNAASYAGGIANRDYCSTTLINCTFIGNSVHSGGAGMFDWHSASTLINCNFSGNFGRYGAAMQIYDSSSTLTNCTYSGNFAREQGGALYVRFSSVELSNCSFSSNVAGLFYGGGIYDRDDSSSLFLTNCILFNNSDSGGMDESAQIHGGTPVVNYCCIQGWTGTWPGLGNTGSDPVFERNPDDGGDGWGVGNTANFGALLSIGSNDDFGDLHLLVDSPCINAGDPDYIAEQNETDLDGKPRVIGGRIDMGAYEFNHIPIADAGPDRNVEAQAPWGATVTLDCSGSSDADSTPGTIDDINDVNWYQLDPCDPNFDVFLGSGRILDCNLPIGEHIILLEVIDKAGASDTNEVTIIVQDTTPPDIICPPDITLECPADTTLSATGKATATDSCGAVTITHSDQWQPSCGNAGTLARTWTATDESGNTSTCVQIITVVDTTPPAITCPPDVTLQCPADTSVEANGPATAVDTCGSATVAHSDEWQTGCGNTGILTRTWTATDNCGNSSSCVQTLTVVDTTPPQFEFSVAPTMLWPPDHKMVLITPSWTVSDDCDATPDVSLVSIVANEGDNTIGDGHTSNDIQIGEDSSIYLRSERSGTSNDRVYTITYQAIDDCGNTTVRSATVSIPHDFKVLARIASRWLWAGPGRIPEDLNGDGFVNLKDIAIFANNWIQ